MQHAVKKFDWSPTFTEVEFWNSRQATPYSAVRLSVPIRDSTSHQTATAAYQLTAWLTYYNEARLHLGINCSTPARIVAKVLT